MSAPKSEHNYIVRGLALLSQAEELRGINELRLNLFIDTAERELGITKFEIYKQVRANAIRSERARK